MPTLLCCFIFWLWNNIKSGPYGSAVGYSTSQQFAVVDFIGWLSLEAKPRPKSWTTSSIVWRRLKSVIIQCFSEVNVQSLVCYRALMQLKLMSQCNAMQHELMQSPAVLQIQRRWRECHLATYSSKHLVFNYLHPLAQFVSSYSRVSLSPKAFLETVLAVILTDQMPKENIKALRASWMKMLTNILR